MPGGKRIVKQMVVNLRSGSLEIVDIGIERVGVALTYNFCKPTVEVGERNEDAYTPQCAEKVEQHVSHGGTLRCNIAAQRGKDRSNGGSYI